MTASTGSQLVLACRGLHKSFGSTVAIDGVDFCVAAGEVFGLLGPNGAGKTTTIKIVTGLLAADRGEVVVDGHRVDREPLRTKAAIGYVPHELALYGDLAAVDNLRLWGRLQGLRSDLAERVEEALEFVGLEERARQRVSEMSAGMQRRLNLAVALLHRPKLLVLDEPTVGIDAESRGQILQRLRDMCARGVAILYTSHYVDEVEQLCDVVAVLDGGRLVAQGTPRSLLLDAGALECLHLTVHGDTRQFVAAVRELGGVDRVEAAADSIRVFARACATTIAPVVQAARDLDLTIASIELLAPDLREVLFRVGRSADEIEREARRGGVSGRGA